MTTETQTSTPKNGEDKRPDWIARQYRVIRIEDGWKTRKERIGVAFNREDGGICFRPTGQQVIEGDVYFYPYEDNNQ